MPLPLILLEGNLGAQFFIIRLGFSGSGEIGVPFTCADINGFVSHRPSAYVGSN